MRMLTGALLLLVAEQAYAHANLVQFPNQVDARAILLPAAVVFLALGSLLLVWGVLTEPWKCGGSARGSPPPPT